MFDVPGFDPSSLSDDDLMNKQAELSRRLSWAARFSSSGDMANQLMAMMAAIDLERRDRLLRAMFSERQKLVPDIIETDPDLAAEHKKSETSREDDQRMSTRRKVGRERLILTKTANPVAVQPHAVQKTDQPTGDQPEKE